MGHEQTREAPGRHPSYAVTADVVAVSTGGGRRWVLLVQRKNEPFRGMWAIPGGFLEPDEDLDECARREFEEETGLAGVAVRQFKCYGTPGRDPRGRTITVAFLALVDRDSARPAAGSDAALAEWWDVDSLPPLAFDHNRIIRDAMEAASKASV